MSATDDRRPAPGRPGRCARCYLRVERCLCSLVPRVATRTRIIIVRHALERHKPSNSARLLALALPGATLVDYGLADDAERSLSLDDLFGRQAPGAWLLWPEGPIFDPGLHPSPTTLVVLDGSWPQARRMRQRLAEVRRLPCLSLPAPKVFRHERLRAAPSSSRLSTLEAVARALALLEGEEVARSLDGLYDELCKRSIPQSRGATARRTRARSP